MDIESFRDYVLSLPACEEDTPFGENVLVHKVGGRIFSIIYIDNFTFINVKCDPDLAIELREKYECIEPGWHMNKKHWNTIRLGRDETDALIEEWVRHSYLQVADKLPRVQREEIYELARRDGRFSL